MPLAHTTSKIHLSIIGYKTVYTDAYILKWVLRNLACVFDNPCIAGVFLYANMH